MIDLTCPILQGVHRHPDNVAVTAGDTKITYRELNGMVERRMVILTANGVAAGSRVGLSAVTNVETVVSFFAALRLGATAALLNMRWPLGELEAVNERLQLSHLLSGRGDQVRRNVTLEAKEPQPGVVFFTSGTGSCPKAALLSEANLIYNANGSNQRIPLDYDSCWLLSLPLYHVGGVGILYRIFLAGGAVAIPSQGESLASAIPRLALSHLSVVHTQLWRLVRDGSLKLRKWPVCLMGGGPTTAELISLAVSRGIPLHMSYGLTEMGSQVTTTECIRESSDPSMTGSPLPHRKVQLSQAGDIWVAGETLFQGYLTDGGLELSRDKSGFFHTGDIGELSAGGSLRILGRKDNQFISGGENIHPEAIEAVLKSVPDIEMAIVVPMDDPEFGKRPAAFVSCEDGGRLSIRTVASARKILGDQLPGLMHPVAWYSLPHDWAEHGIKPRRSELIDLLKNPQRLIPPAP